MIHAILFSILVIVTLVFLGSELKKVCRVEKMYMEPIPTYADREVYRDDADM